MSDAIKGAFAHDGKLFLRGESGIYTVQDNGKEPRDWTSEQFSGANEGLEAFQAFCFDEVHEMVNITNIHCQDRQDLTDAIMVMVLEGLFPGSSLHHHQLDTWPASAGPASSSHPARPPPTPSYAGPPAPRSTPQPAAYPVCSSAPSPICRLQP
jgi:hypothetical protein